MVESLGTSVLDLATDDSELQQGLSDAKGKTKAAAAAIGVAAGAALTAGAVESMQREALGDKLAAQINLTGAESERAGRIAGELYSNAYGSSLEEVNAALAGVHTNIGELGSFTDTQIRGMTTQALDLATAMEVDVVRATRAAGQLIRNGLAENADQAFDIMTAGMQGLDATMREELIDTIEEYSADFASLGLDGPQAIGMISAAVQAGARNTDLAADAIREFSITAIDGSESTADAFEALGFDADAMAAKIAAGGPQTSEAMGQVVQALTTMQDPIEQNELGIALFGTRFEELGVDAVAALDPTASKLEGVASATERMGQTLNDNAQTNITAFQRSIEGMLTRLVEAPGVVGTASSAVAGMGLVLQPVAPLLTGVGIIFKDVLGSMVSSVASASGRVVASTARMTARTVAATVTMIARWALMGVQSLIHAAKVAAAWLIAMGPIGLVIAAVVGLVALIVANWDTVKRVTVRLWRTVSAATSRAWAAITSAIGRAASAVTSTLSRAWAAVQSAATRAWTTLTSTVTGAWRRIAAAVSSGISRVLGFVRSLPGRIRGALGNLGGLLLSAGRAVIEGFLRGITGAFDRVRSTLGRLTSMLPSWKGPLTDDRRILVDAGHAVIGGFVTGLEGEFPTVEAVLAGVTGDLTAAAAPPGGAGTADRRPLRVEFDFLGAGDLVDLMRRSIRTVGGGSDVQATLGGRA